jgi:hypothetical protein
MTRKHPLHGLATRFGAGDLARRYYHDPIGKLHAMVLEGGPWQQRLTERGRRDMIAAALSLPRLEAPIAEGNFEVSFLSGAKYWYQTLFCVYSLQKFSTTRISPIIYDDGSFTEGAVNSIMRVIPWAKFVLDPESEARLNELLPDHRFPILRERRLIYPHLRKLCDIHVGRSGWRVVLDSDMLFFSAPEALLEWLAAPKNPCHLIDTQRAYGYSEELMAELSGRQEPVCVNVGVCGLRSETIDWERLEHWCRVMIEREGTSYLQEQALTALLLADKTCVRLPADDYRVMPPLREGRNPSAALHHYVAHSKRSYFQYGWRRVVEGSCTQELR